jgi:glucose/arabinose dehydrogenase
VPTVAGTVATGLSAPWGLAFLPDGSALVSERDSSLIKRLDGAGGVTTVGTVPGVDHTSEGGLLGIAVAADFAARPDVYAYLTAEKDNRIVRMAYKDGTLAAPEVVLAGIPKGSIHNGGRLAFGPDGMLYAGTGEVGERGLAQRRDSLGGKILRLTRAGKVPADNPTRGSYVFSRGHRNVQGLAFDAKGRLFASEFGQHTWDELNLIRPGRNSGWPVVEGRAGDKRFDDPVAQWRTSEASPSGIAMVGDTIFMAALRGERLWRITLGTPGRNGIPSATTKAFFTGRWGRLRTVAVAPDGSLWLVTNNTDRRGVPRPGDDRVLRLTLK